MNYIKVIFAENLSSQDLIRLNSSFPNSIVKEANKMSNFHSKEYEWKTYKLPFSGDFKLLLLELPPELHFPSEEELSKIFFHYSAIPLSRDNLFNALSIVKFERWIYARDVEITAPYRLDDCLIHGDGEKIFPSLKSSKAFGIEFDWTWAESKDPNNPIKIIALLSSPLSSTNELF